MQKTELKKSLRNLKPLVFHGIIFMFVIFTYRSQKYVVNLVMSLIIPTFIFLLLLFYYNFLRFGNIFETGLTYHIGNPRYEAILKQRKIFSPDFIPFNFQHFFLFFPKISLSPPFLSINLEGNSLFAFYPALLFIPVFIKRLGSIIRKNPLLISFVVVFVLELSLLLNYFATGWTQVGMRYFFDLIPVTFLLLLFVIDRIPKIFAIIILLYSVLINISGALIFYDHWPF